MHDRIYAAIEHMENHVSDGGASLHDAAKAACLSEYHFHRIFKSMTGMSPMLYQRRRALTLAAGRLLEGEKNILHLAIDYGYESQEAFTRAFKDMFGMPPGKLRSSGKTPAPLLQQPLTLDALQYFTSGIEAEPEIREHKAFTLSGLSKDVDFDGYKDISLLWRAYLPRFQTLPHTVYGVCRGTADANGKPSERLRYSAAAETINGPDEEQIDIPANTYAVFTHDGKMADIDFLLKYIWQIWIPRSKYELVDAPDFETYGADFDQKALTGVIKIWIPISRP